ncbi:hercynine oxygenase [Microbulbifer aestuariivivens]|uniref:Hercynine oxygenase n=1 Tax=Microbulbifer aestuariivivens TaxID=1908308 RepID=A0ABP9WK45_9GAMM
MTLPAPEVPKETQFDLLSRYRSVRAETEQLATPLSAEDMQIQSMADASPTKWHLAHTTWFYETFILRELNPQYRVFDPRYHEIFNSYYHSLGQPFSRPLRGLLSRPSIDEIYAYRAYVDRAISTVLQGGGEERRLNNLVLLGLNHEQQHQELLLTDIKHALSINPLLPAYINNADAGSGENGQKVEALEWIAVNGGIFNIGASAGGDQANEGDNFCFDNETPSHPLLVQDFRIASRLVTNGEFLEFIEDGGYRQHRLWLSDGWSWVNTHSVQHPHYWRRVDGSWQQFTLCGLQPLAYAEPVCHLNFYEADAFATWAGFRLPTEFEWEVAACQLCTPDDLAAANLLEKRHWHPAASHQQRQLLGDVWEWTSSAYQPYPGFRASGDAVGEYNGKFMCNQKVLRGGSCVTPSSHIRSSYRNFFYPHQFWQFTGIRLAGDAL